MRSIRLMQDLESCRRGCASAGGRRLSGARADVDDDLIVLEPRQRERSRRRSRACAFASSAGNSPMSRKVSTCRSGITSRCVSACGLMSRSATKPSALCDVIALVERACRTDSRQAATIPSSVTAAARTRISSPTSPLDEPWRVVVPVATSGPIDEDDVVAAELRTPVREARARDCARRRALRSFFTAAGTGSSPAVFVPGRGEYGKDVHFCEPRLDDDAQRVRERALVLGRKADDHVGREVEVVERLEAAQVRRGRVAASHRAQHAVVAGLQRHVQVARDRRRFAERRHEVVVDVVDLDRREPQALEARGLADLADEPRQRVAGLAVAKAARG